MYTEQTFYYPRGGLGRFRADMLILKSTYTEESIYQYVDQHIVYWNDCSTIFHKRSFQNHTHWGVVCEFETGLASV